MPMSRRVNDAQLHCLIDFVERNKDICLGHQSNSSLYQRNAFKKWEDLATNLNSMGNQRSPTDWRKYWVELKFRVRRKTTDQKTDAEDGSQRQAKPLMLSDFEERVYNIIKPIDSNHKTHVASDSDDSLSSLDNTFEVPPIKKEYSENYVDKSSKRNSNKFIEKNSIAESLMVLARSQEEMAKTQQQMADTLEGIRSDLREFMSRHTGNY